MIEVNLKDCFVATFLAMTVESIEIPSREGLGWVK